jgi:hypothetical protein
MDRLDSFSMTGCISPAPEVGCTWPEDGLGAWASFRFDAGDAYDMDPAASLDQSGIAFDRQHVDFVEIIRLLYRMLWPLATHLDF